MADAIRKTIRKIRHKFKRPPEKPEPLWKKWQAEERAAEYMQEFWERDKRTVRDANFKKALAAKALILEAINAEKKRQEEIAELRLKNLKKARRKLARIRSQNEQ